MPEREPTNSSPSRFRIGSYGILHILGTGGMSTVYRASHVETGHEVALKVLAPAKARNATILKRFIGEARSTEALQHPNIVQIFDRGSDDGRYYLVLEYVEGGDLHDYVRHRGPLPVDEAVGLIAQVVQALDYAESRGVIHRDIKPSNLLRTSDGEVKISDLGLALRMESDDERVTREGTTVGTVDYMAPEQARDSRATSFRSDVYSLGCTFYYLLTGLPPFPGGELTEKLTRHAREPAPDVQRLRPDVPPAVSAIVRRMMEKKPEDRFGSYRELLTALGRLSADESSIALVPIEDDSPEPKSPRERAALAAASLSLQESVERPPSSMPEISLSAFAPSLLEDGAESALGTLDPEPLVRRGSVSESAPLPLPTATERWTSSDPSEHAWILRCVLIGLAVIVTVIGLDLIIRPFPNLPLEAFTEDPTEPIRLRDRAGDAVTSASPQPSPRVPESTAPPVDPAPDAEAVAKLDWVEPSDLPTTARPPKSYTPETLAAYLPEWARTPFPAEDDDRTTVVRRVPNDGAPRAATTLRQGLDAGRGVVELADVGPFVIDDFRIPGDNRVIRSRPGYRAVVRIDGSKLDAVRSLPGAVMLDGRSLTLESLDLVIDVRSLGMHQKALFHGSGFNLTLKNCTVTIVNQLSAPFVFLRADDAGSRPSRLRIEDSLIRGDVSAMFAWNRGRVEASVFRSILVSAGPIVQTQSPTAASQPDHRLSLLGSVLACRGPLVELRGEAKADSTARRLSVRSHDSVFARIAGAGVSSLTSSDGDAGAFDRILEWTGGGDLYVGWAGYFADGTEHTVRSSSLASFRSTWNGQDGASREIPTEWPALRHLADFSPSALVPFLPGWEEIIEAVARPRPFLIARTLWSFQPPSPPTLAPLDGVVPGRRELEFDADAATPWRGDLGAFLRDTVAPTTGRCRVRVVGSGLREFTPVHLARGSTVEIVVQQPVNAERPPLVYVPVSNAQGEGLIAVDQGVLSLSGLRFRVEKPTGLESLIRVQDGWLSMNRCEFAAPGPLEEPPVLVWFQATSSRPTSEPSESPVLLGTANRRACLITESLLYTTGSAVRAEVGVGVVRASGSILAARGDVFSLSPGAVARDRFTADLMLDQCTIATAGSAVRVSAWTGMAPGPDRPWLISSKDVAYVDLSDRNPRESVLCRADADAFAQGQLFWTQERDAIEVFGFGASDQTPPPNRTRDVISQWVDLWGANHIRDVTGPRPGAGAPSVRLVGRPKGGRLEPADLLLDPNHFLGRPRLDVGANPTILTLGRNLDNRRQH